MRIVYTRADSVVCVVHAAAKEDIETQLGKMSTEEYEQHVWEKSVPKDSINAVKLADDTLLPDREFRNAWIHDGKNFGHDLEKARNIQLANIRSLRNPKLQALDGPYMKALEVGDSDAMKTIAAEKQKLRDLTEPLKAMKLGSIDDVRKAFPVELK